MTQSLYEQYIYKYLQILQMIELTRLINTSFITWRNTRPKQKLDRARTSLGSSKDRSICNPGSSFADT